MIDDLYNGKLLELAGNPVPAPRLADPDATAKAHSKLCGSTVIVDLELDGVLEPLVPLLKHLVEPLGLDDGAGKAVEDESSRTRKKMTK